MLTDDQVNRTWDETLAAEVRALYFAELGSTFTNRKQVISGASFFLASAAAATIVASLPKWVPVLLSGLTAVMMAYSIVSLDKKAATMAKLHYAWSQIESDYRRLWNHWYEDDAEDVLKDVQLRAREASQLAITDAPYKADLVKKWRTCVHQQYGITPA